MGVAAHFSAKGHDGMLSSPAAPKKRKISVTALGVSSASTTSRIEPQQAAPLATAGEPPIRRGGIPPTPEESSRCGEGGGGGDGGEEVLTEAVAGSTCAPQVLAAGEGASPRSSDCESDSRAISFTIRAPSACHGHKHCRIHVASNPTKCAQKRKTMSRVACVSARSAQYMSLQ